MRMPKRPAHASGPSRSRTTNYKSPDAIRSGGPDWGPPPSLFRGSTMKVLSAIAVTALALLPASALAASPEPPGGAAACTGCHATNPAAETPVPKINGQKAEEFMVAMAAFRTGAKPSTVMGRIAKGYTDEELRPLAVWFA